MIDRNLIHVGDIVITWDKGIGYVTKLEKDCFSWVIEKPREIKNACIAGSDVAGEYNSSVYKQIGCQFNKRLEETSNCIEPLPENTHIFSEIRAKLNEIIEYINSKEQSNVTNN